MRQKRQKQMPLMNPVTDHVQSQELKIISEVIDENPTICDLVMQDLQKGKGTTHKKGANGMSADQVLRFAIVKVLFGYSYQDLAFHTVDSKILSWFCRIGFGDKGFKKAALNKNIKAISSTTWESINADFIGYAKKEKIENGRKVRIDCTCVESNIHPPTDSTLLWDCVRVLTRLMEQGRESGVRLPEFHNHTRVAKRRMLAIHNAKRKKQRTAFYIDLIKATRKVVGYARKAKTVIYAQAGDDLYSIALSLQIENYIHLADKVIDQSERRVVHGEPVAAADKVVSIFETHTDIIIKDRRDTYYGHKICLTGGASNMILDCIIPEGNPADTTLAISMLDRQKQIYGRYPLKACFDGGFASKDNLKRAKSRQIKDICFAKKRGLKETDMCRSKYVYKKLRRFRAGIESGISWLKRSLGLSRCSWKGWRSFKSYVWSSIVSANLLTIARAKTAT